MGNKTRAATLEKNGLQGMLAQSGLPRLLIAGFLLLIMIPFVGVDLPTQITRHRVCADRLCHPAAGIGLRDEAMQAYLHINRWTSLHCPLC